MLHRIMIWFLFCARRASYALMSVGLHIQNGLSATACIHIYKTYVVPRLLYCLEAISLNVGQITELDAFHTRMLPQRCAKCAIYILSGVLPFEALYHYSLWILACLAVRQLSRCSFTSNSWFVRVSKILTKYDLPDLISLLEDTPTEALWKSQIRKAVYGSWEDQLRDTAAEKSTLAYLNVSTFAVGRTHQVWTTTEPCVQDVKRAAVKVKVLISTYLLQATRARFRQNKNITPTCPLCKDVMTYVCHLYWSFFRIKLRCNLIWKIIDLVFTQNCTKPFWVMSQLSF